MDDSAIFIYITTSSITEARRISEELLHDRLVACTNILPEMESMYWWQDKIEKSKECVVIAKSVQENFSKIKSKVVELHSYECPCIIALPIKSGHEPYLKWITKEARPV